MTKSTDLLDILHSGVANIRFTKADGTVRDMKATLNETAGGFTFPDSDPSAFENVQRVWDMDKNAWRSFRWDSLIFYREEK